jgi:hypothetical protein
MNQERNAESYSRGFIKGKTDWIHGIMSKKKTDEEVTATLENVGGLHHSYVNGYMNGRKEAREIEEMIDHAA